MLEILYCNIDIDVNWWDSQVPLPVWIVHVFLSYFVGLGVHIDRVLRLGAHVVLPDDAALFRYLKLIGINSLNLFYFVKRILIKPRMPGVSLNATQILRREDFQLHILSPGKIRSDLVHPDPSVAPNLNKQ